MYYLVENIDDIKDDSVVKIMDEDEIANININLPDEAEVEPTDSADAEVSEEPAKDETTPAEESKQYALPRVDVAEFKKITSENSVYNCIPGCDYTIVGSNISEGINVVIHGMDDGKYHVTSNNNSISYDNYAQAKIGAIREAVAQHKKYVSSIRENTYHNVLQEIYDTCSLDENIKMIKKENYVKAVYPGIRKMVTIEYNTNDNCYVVESKSGSQTSVNKLSDSAMIALKGDIIQSILLGG